MSALQESHRKNCMLIIDDDLINREVIKNIFQEGFQFAEAASGLEGLRQAEQHEGELCAILLDVQMPEMNGMELLQILHDRNLPARIPVFLITAKEEKEIAREAYEMGVMGVINKPVVPFIVERRVKTVLELYQAREALDDRIRQQEQKLQENVKTIDALHRSTLEAMASAIEFRDLESGEHTKRIYGITKLILQKTDMGAGLSEDQIENIAIGSIMHDVGKIAISDVILKKPGRLTKEEFETMKSHTVKGSALMARLIETEDHPSYRYALDIARHHHERWDGGGYPDGLKGNEITVWSQVVSIADVYDALVSPRVYKKAYSANTAVEMIRSSKCGVFNPKLLESFLKIEPELRKLYRNEDGEAAEKGSGRIKAQSPGQNPISPRDSMDFILLTAAIQQFYDMIICANLTDNTFYILNDENAIIRCKGKSGAFDDLIAWGAASIPLSHRQLFLDAFSRDQLLYRYGAGRKTVCLDYPQYTGSGMCIQVSTCVLLLEDPRNGDIRNITLIRYESDAKNPEVRQQLSPSG